MLFYYKTVSNNSCFGIWKITETETELAALLNSETLSDGRFQQFTTQKRRQEWLAVRVLLKTLCSEEKLIIYTEESGKPLLADNSFHISISHTKGYAAVFLSKNETAGIDIEQRGEKILRLKERFMHQNELAALDSMQTATHALLYWSGKETMFKIMDMQAVDFVEHLHIAPFVLSEEGCFSACETRTAMQQDFTVHYQIFEDFVLTWGINTHFSQQKL